MNEPALTPEARDLRRLALLWRDATPAERQAARRRAKKIAALFDSNETGPVWDDAEPERHAP